MFTRNDIETIGIAGKPLEEIARPTVKLPKALYELWLSKERNGIMPCRDDFSPAEMTPILPYIYMIDVLEGGADYQMRLFGTALAEIIGKDYTGAKLSELDPEKGWRGAIYKLAYERAAPMFYHFDLGDADKPHLKTENALLPLRGKDGTFSILLCASQVIDSD